MVRFDWKYCDKEQFPPEPEFTKDFWKQENPGWVSWKVLDWYSETFETYACKLKGETSPVPAQLYYIGNREWMTESGYVWADGHVEAWDSYTDDGVGQESDLPYAEGTIKIDGRKFHANLSTNSKGLLFAAGYLIALLREREPESDMDKILSDLGMIAEYVEEGEEDECTE